MSAIKEEQNSAIMEEQDLAEEQNTTIPPVKPPGRHPVRDPKLVHYGPTVSKYFMEGKLYDQQKEALRGVEKWFKDEETKKSTAVVVMPTGSGKSGVICCLPYYLGGAGISDINFHKPILVIAPGLIIRDQLYDDLQEDPFLLKFKFIEGTEMDYLGYNVRSIINTDQVSTLGNVTQCDIVLTNAQKWRKTSRDNPTPNYTDLQSDMFSVIIVDEAHHLPAKQWQEIITKFKKHAKVVFFTATPNRADREKITDDLHIVRFAYELSRDDAIKEKLIREVEIDIIKETEDKQHNKPTPEELVLKKVKERMKEKNRKLLPGGKKHASIIVTPTIKIAKEIEDLCTTKIGFHSNSVQLVTSDNNKDTNDKIIKSIKAGKYEVIIIVSMLLEGFDYPPLSIAGILTKIRSPVKFAQFIGRVQRLVREEGETEENIKADVITHEHFEQKKMKEAYENPVIPEVENKDIDAIDA